MSNLIHGGMNRGRGRPNIMLDSSKGLDISTSFKKHGSKPSEMEEKDSYSQHQPI